MEIKSKKYHCELRNRKATIDVVKCFRKFIPPFRYLLPLLTLLLMYFFPTLLDVFSVCSKYRGVGRSLFDVSGANDKEKAENISRLILEGGFFTEND